MVNGEESSGKKLVKGQECLEKRMDSIVDDITQQADGITQQTRESNAQTLDKLVALDSKIGKLAHGQEQQARLHTAHILQLQGGTKKARGQLHAQERDIERLRAEGHTGNRQLRHELDSSFRNELMSRFRNELDAITNWQNYELARL